MKINYAARSTRFDLSMACSVLARHLIDTPHIAYRGLLQLLRYIHWHIDLGIRYSSGKPLTPAYYSDADYLVGRPRLGYCMTMSGGITDWASTLSVTMATGTPEAELYGAVFSGKRALITRKDVEALRVLRADEELQFFEDNFTTLLNLNMQVTYNRMKHLTNGWFKALVNGSNPNGSSGTRSRAQTASATSSPRCNLLDSS